MKKKIVISTRNKDKLKEIKKIFEMMKCDNYELFSIADFENLPEVEEDRNTLRENAIKKAKTIGDIVGLPTVSEDTGLFVDYLNGEPGVYSARYADTTKKHTCSYEDNYKKLLKKLEGVPWEKRTAEFVCTTCLYLPKKNKYYIRTGKVQGYITFEPKGSNGFGYDPVFYYPPKQKTFAELSLEEKNLISHRFLAFKKIISVIKESV